jgi:hypothetical protein
MDLLPGDNFSPSPKAGLAGTSIDDRSGEVAVTMLVRRDAVALAQPEKAGHLDGVNEVIDRLVVWHERQSTTVDRCNVERP